MLATYVFHIDPIIESALSTLVTVLNEALPYLGVAIGVLLGIYVVAWFLKPDAVFEGTAYQKALYSEIQDEYYGESDFDDEGDAGGGEN